MYHRIAAALYGEPWYLSADQHLAFSLALQPYLTGEQSARYGREERKEDIPGVSISDGIALMYVHGPIGRHLSFFERACTGGFDSAFLEYQINKLRSRDDVNTVVLSFHSPGGLAVGCHEIAMQLRELSESKRTIAWVDNMCCSAAYYYAAGCDEIYSTPTGTVGSIGTYCAVIDRSREWEMKGLKMNLFTSGPIKGAGVPGLPLSEGQIAFFQERVNLLSSQFHAFVRDRRPAVSDAALDGRHMTGEEGMQAGLVDSTYLSMDHLLATLL